MKAKGARRPRSRLGQWLDGLGIRWHIFGYLIAFVAVMLVLLWVFQILLLDPFYRAIRTRAIQNTAQSIARRIDDEDLSTQLDNLTQQPDIYVRIFDQNGNSVYNSFSGPQSMIHGMSKEQAAGFYQAAVENGGTVLKLFRKDFPNPFDDGFHPPKGESRGAGDAGFTTLMVYGQLVTAQDGRTLLILLSSALTPVNTTVETLKVQFLCLAAILLALSAAIAILLSRRIGGPLVSLNRSAAVLATGKYDVTFDGRGYREVSELSSTLTYAAQELSKVEGLRQELIANVSHDLRTPLTMIAGYSEVMRDIPGENTPENIQIIIDETQRLTGLVNDMLDLAKLQAGSQTLSPQPLSLTGMVEEVLGRYQRLIEREGYVITFSHGEEAMVSGDPSKLTQVVYNLINNAINYTGPDKTVRVEQEAADGWVTLSVLDSGPGIDPAHQPYIWERYYKVDKAHKRAAIGTGLGLSIVKGVVELHHGRYGVESSPGSGSRFWFSLPLLPPEEPSPAGQERQEKIPPGC